MAKYPLLWHRIETIVLGTVCRKKSETVCVEKKDASCVNKHFATSEMKWLHEFGMLFTDCCSLTFESKMFVWPKWKWFEKNLVRETGWTFPEDLGVVCGCMARNPPPRPLCCPRGMRRRTDDTVFAESSLPCSLSGEEKQWRLTDFVSLLERLCRSCPSFVNHKPIQNYQTVIQLCWFWKYFGVENTHRCGWPKMSEVTARKNLPPKATVVCGWGWKCHSVTLLIVQHESRAQEMWFLMCSSLCLRVQSFSSFWELAFQTVWTFLKW